MDCSAGKESPCSAINSPCLGCLVLGRKIQLCLSKSHRCPGSMQPKPDTALSSDLTSTSLRLMHIVAGLAPRDALGSLGRHVLRGGVDGC